MTGSDADPRESLASRDVGPIVPLPRARLSGAAIAAGCSVLGLFLFLTLDVNRRALSAPDADRAARQSTISAPPALAIPQPPPVPEILSPAPTPLQPKAVTPPVTTAVQAAPPLYASAPPPPAQATEPAPSANRSDGQILLMDLGGTEAAAAAGAAAPAAGSAPAGDDQAVRASIIRNRSSLVPQGTLIAAVLETPIDSSRAGLARAVVSRDVRGFDGTRILIPRGSRLIGEAQGDAQPGQKRVLVTWTRLIRPDGVAIRIGSPGADSLGGAGVTGRVNTHFAGRFANAVLQSALAIGVNLASRPGEGSVVVGVPGQVGSAVGQIPVFNVPAGPTIRVAQGAEIAIFVARDLDFGVAVPRQ